MRSHLTESRSQETTADRRAPTGSRFRPLLVIATSLALVALFVTIAVVHRDAGGCRSPRRSAGIDVSSFQGVINWSEVARTCIGFAYLRVAAGRTVDPTYGPNATAARSTGLAVGSYQYFHPEQDALAQARLFISHVAFRRGDLAPVIDVETTSGVPRAVLLSRLHTWLATVGTALGARPMIYTSPSFWTAHVHARAFTSYPLWIASYTRAARPLLPEGGWDGSGWTLWQYDSQGRVAGIDSFVDLDRAAR